MHTATRLWLFGILWTSVLCLLAFAAEIPPTGSGAAYASRCNAAKQRWIDVQGRVSVSQSTYNNIKTFLVPSTIYTTSTYLSTSDATPYMLCDGWPRMNGSRTITSTLSPYTILRTVELKTTIYRNISQPKCTIEASDCAILRSSYTRQLVVYNSNSTAIDGPTSPIPPVCGSATLVSFSSDAGSPACAMKEASVQLLYWPVQTVRPCDACHRSDCPVTTLGPTISGKPNTFVTLNNTLTSPTVYIAFEGKWVYATGDTTYSRPQALLIAQSSESVSTFCGKAGGGYGPPRSLNYANFIDPVPADVYRCQPSCFVNPLPYPEVNVTSIITYPSNSSTTIVTAVATSTVSHADKNLCSTIWDDYRPVLSIPHEFRTINPAGFGQDSMFGIPVNYPCNFIFDEDAVLFDPPIALTEASSAAKPTLPGANSAYPTGDSVGYQTSIPIATAQAQSLGSPQHSDPKPGPTLPNPRPDPTGGSSPASPSLPKSQPGSTGDSSSRGVGDVIASVVGMTRPGQGKPGDRWTLALATDGLALVVNDMTASIANAQQPDDGTITMGRSKVQFTEDGGTIVIGDQTLAPGGTITVGGDGSEGTQTDAPTRTSDSSGSASPAGTTISGASSRTAVSSFLVLMSALIATTYWLVT